MKSSKILIAVFLVLLIAPMAVFPLLSGVIDTDNHENRAYADFPDLLEDPAGFAAGFDSWFNDRLPFKNQLKKVHSALNLALFNTTSSARVVVGKQDWLFYNNYDAENPIDDIMGKSFFTEEELALIPDNIRKACGKYESSGTRFVLMVPPNKETIYSELLPSWLEKEIAEETRMDILFRRLENDGIGICYPKDALISEKEDHQLYYKYDTHWNKLGGYIGFRELCSFLGYDVPELSECELFEDDEYPRDLAELSGMSSVYVDDREFTVNYNPGVTVSIERNEGYDVYQGNGPVDQTVLLVHDSYYESMIDYFARTFSTVVEVPRNYSDLYGNNYLIEMYDPDIIVMEVVERGAGILFRGDMPY